MADVEMPPAPAHVVAEPATASAKAAPMVWHGVTVEHVNLAHAAQQLGFTEEEMGTLMEKSANWPHRGCEDGERKRGSGVIGVPQGCGGRAGTLRSLPWPGFGRN